MKPKTYVIPFILISVILLYVMLTTRPDTVPLLVLIVPFVCIFLLASLTVYAAFRVLLKRPHSVSIMLFALLAGAVTALSLGLNSVGSLLPREIAIVVIFTIILVFYFFKRRR